MDPRPRTVTAVVNAFIRAYHATHDSPVVFDDRVAAALFTDEERTHLGDNLARALDYFEPGHQVPAADRLARSMRVQSTPVLVARARYCEDLLSVSGLDQYVILGAGLDTFGFRERHIEVFELDHPTVQADKRERVARAGWAIPATLHLVPVDLASQRASDVLRGTGFDPARPAFVSWLGVTYYLTRDVVTATLADLATVLAPGSRLVFDFLDAAAFGPARGERMAKLFAIVERVGEPFRSGFAPGELAELLGAAGFALDEVLDPPAIHARYLRDTDYRAYEHFHVASALSVTRFVGRISSQSR